MFWHTSLPRCCQQAEHHPLGFKLCSCMVNYQWNIINQVHLGHLFERQLPFMATCSRWYNSSGLNDCTFCICVSCIRYVSNVLFRSRLWVGYLKCRSSKRHVEHTKIFHWQRLCNYFLTFLQLKKTGQGGVYDWWNKLSQRIAILASWKC